MQVTLKQSEIEQAIKGFVMQQGINLYGKTVEVSFTAGRKESGISAEIDIDDMEIGNATVRPVPVPPAFIVEAKAQATPVVSTVTEENEVQEEEKVVEVSEPTKSTSLFG